VTTDVAALAAQVRSTRQHLDREAGRAWQVGQAWQAVEAEIATLEELAAQYARVAALLTTVGEEAQETARGRFEALATRALRHVFGENLSFGLVAGESGGQATLEAVIRSDYGGTITETPVLTARGGGMAAVTGFVMRLVMLLLTPGVRRILFLDESFGFVSESYVPRVASLLRDVADQAGVQVVLATHNPVFAQYADSRVRLALGDDGVTQVFENEVE
jgi:hypothetical protein